MANGAEIAQAYVQIIPTTEGIGNKISTAISGETNGEQIGQSLGSKISSGIGSGLKTAGVVMASTVTAATGLAAGIGNIATQSASTADNIDKMSQKIGISRQAYQELDFICSQSGTSVDGLQAGMKTLTTAITGAANGTKSNVEQFKQLGVAVTDANGNIRSQEDVLFETIGALQKMENQTEKARLASQLFGRSGTELMPLLNGEAGSMEEMKNQAHELGLVLSDELIDSGVELTDSLDQTKRALASMGTQMGSALMPLVTQFSDSLQSFIPTLSGMVTQIGPSLASIFSTIGPPLMELIQQLLPVLLDLINQLLPPIAELMSAILPVVVDILKVLLPPLMEIIQAVLPPLIDIITAILPIVTTLIEALAPLGELILPLLVGAIQLITSILTPLLEIIAQVVTWLVDKLGEGIQIVVDWLVGKLGPAFESLKVWLGDLKEKFSEVWTNITQFVTDAVAKISSKWAEMKNTAITVFSALRSSISAIFNSIWGVIRGVVNSILSGIETMCNGVVNGINTLLGGISTIASAAGSIIGLDPINLSLGTVSLPRLEKGGVLEKGQVGLLEGNGAEAVVPLENNSRWISAVAKDMSAMNGGNAEEISLLEEIKVALESLQGMNIVLDSGATVGALAMPLNNALGRIQSREGRR